MDKRYQRGDEKSRKEGTCISILQPDRAARLRIFSRKRNDPPDPLFPQRPRANFAFRFVSRRDDSLERRRTLNRSAPRSARHFSLILSYAFPITSPPSTPQFSLVIKGEGSRQLTKAFFTCNYDHFYTLKVDNGWINIQHFWLLVRAILPTVLPIILHLKKCCNFIKYRLKIKQIERSRKLKKKKNWNLAEMQFRWC